jgi:hypothetical protein
MDKTQDAQQQLRRIQDLWSELGRTRLDSPKREVLMKEIQTLSKKYQDLVDRKDEPRNH